MSTAATLLEANAQLWERIRAHPFVHEAAAGTLSREAFDRWLVEDHYFVVAGRRFVGRMMELAPDEAARDLLAGAVAALGTELELFRREARTRNLDLDVEPCPTNLGYAAFLLASAADGFPTTVTVLYGAEKAYFDAWRVVRERASQDSPYWAFIDNWSSPAFGDWVGQVAGLLDRVVPDGPDARLQRIFTRVARFELRFWDAVHAGETW